MPLNANNTQTINWQQLKPHIKDNPISENNILNQTIIEYKIMFENSNTNLESLQNLQKLNLIKSLLAIFELPKTIQSEIDNIKKCIVNKQVLSKEWIETTLKQIFNNLHKTIANSCSLNINQKPSKQIKQIININFDKDAQQTVHIKWQNHKLGYKWEVANLNNSNYHIKKLLVAIKKQRIQPGDFKPFKLQQYNEIAVLLLLKKYQKIMQRRIIKDFQKHQLGAPDTKFLDLLETCHLITNRQFLTLNYPRK